MRVTISYEDNEIELKDRFLGLVHKFFKAKSKGKPKKNEKRNNLYVFIENIK